MRLLNRHTLEFKWFANKPPPYIILSHCWIGQETTLQEFEVQRKQDESTWSAGVAKVVRFCKEVGSDRWPEEFGYQYDADYVWIDTCCIDKTSSTELQEAINSMFKWYERAKLCIVWLHDVDIAKEHTPPIELQMEMSTWFTRGWTLQELIAPQKLLLVDCEWRKIGDRDGFSYLLEKITHIPGRCLGRPSSVYALTIAERMTWLSTRRTTREEDLAYCMLGIFDINMPMLYGEGKKAFMRLQKELLQASNDESIFLWTSFDGLYDELGDWYPLSTILAPVPRCFSCLTGREVQLDCWFDREHPRVTAKGLEIETWNRRDAQFGEKLVVPLNVLVDGMRVGIELLAIPYYRDPIYRDRDARVSGAEWERVGVDSIHTVQSELFGRPPSAKEQYKRHIRDAEKEAQRQRLQGLSHAVRSPVQRQSLGHQMRDEMTPSTQLADRQLTVPDYTPKPLFGAPEYIAWYKSELISFKIYIE